MLSSPLMRPVLRAIGLLSSLALTGCAALTDGTIEYDGSPCNVLCQKWMGIEARPQTAPAPMTSAARDVSRPSITRRKPSDRHRFERAEDRHPTGIMAAKRTRRPPAAASADGAKMPVAASASAGDWGKPLPGSYQTMPGIWLPPQ